MKLISVDGRPFLWQWDTNIFVKATIDIEELHYLDEGETKAIKRKEDKTFRIPDKLLQKSGLLYFWAYTEDRTKSSTSIQVACRPKPPEYVTNDESNSSSRYPVATKESLGVIMVGDYLTIDKNGRLNVDATTELSDDYTKVATTSLIYKELGNISALLSTI